MKGRFSFQAALHGVFTNADTSSREQICSALTILQKTVLQVYQLFAPLDGPSRTMERMRLLVATPWQPGKIGMSEEGEKLAWCSLQHSCKNMRKGRVANYRSPYRMGSIVNDEISKVLWSL